MPAATLGPKTLADGKIRLVYCPTLKDPTKPTLAELNAGVDLSCRVLKSDFKLSASGSETVDDLAALCDETKPVVYGPSNFEGSLTVFRWYDPNNLGRHDAQGDIAYQTLKVRGTQGYLIKRETGKRYDVAWEAGDEVEVFSILTDNPQAPSETGGYIRRTIPMGVQSGYLDAVVANAA
ncbi:hypothetical protein [uncultured Kocuria sp.]|uniref:phage tail tube protein n=1 Tax=uncultured Kocuria sp. TaxID=259305 RepID=UPI0025953B68|nr:hypothetical protein [uncultured Kocuria sp.]MCT1368400.1 hypothetical protein [Rothia sp. p3-SID1597]